MFYLLFTTLALCLHTSVYAQNNASEDKLSPRTFSGFFLTVTDEPVYLDLDYYLDLDLWDHHGDSGSGAEQPAKVHPHPHPKKSYHVSERARAFLQGRLATAFVPAVYTVVFLVSVPLNLVAVVMFARRIRPRKPAVIYMMNLACADLLFAFLLPFRIAYHFHGNDWIYGAGMCRLVTAAFYCNMYCSVLLMMCIGIDRFLAVVYPMDSLVWRCPRTASVVCGAMWLLSAGGVTPLLLSRQDVHLADLGITTCHDVQDVSKLRAYYLYFFPIYSSVFFFIPLVITAVCYARIVQALAAANVDNRTRKTRAVVMALTVLVVFVVCFTPTNVILLVHYIKLSHHHADGSYQAYLLSMCVSSISCCLDPLIYYFGSSQCQRQVAALLRCKAGGAEVASQSGSTRTSRMESLRSTLGGQYRKLVG
ncbi:proteinase-activated receptor 1 [Osmerus eperlanus]|uniref:proteinase-activated receptor 1 n=1 Tax=Osmerus eperlanus TaxID=29151 RepID=UPI002E101352